MRSASKAIPPRLFILIPLSLGLMVRLVGLRHGAPALVYHPDMAKQILVARSTYQGQSDPLTIYGAEDMRRCLYPYGTAVITGKLARLYSAVTGEDFGNDHRFLWALRMRYFTVTLFLAAVALVLLALFKTLGPVATVLTGALLCLEPITAQFSHYGMNDVPLLAMLMLSWIAAGMMARDKAFLPAFSLLSGLFAGLAFGIKYQGILGLIFPGVAVLALLRQKGWKWVAAAALCVAAGFLGGALLTCPLWVSAPSYFFRTLPEFMAWQANVMERPIPLSEKLPRNIAAVACMLWKQGHWLIVAGAVWAIASRFKVRRPADPGRPVLSAFLFCAVILSAMIGARDIIRPNDLILPTGFLILLCGSAIGKATHPWKESGMCLRYTCSLAAFVLTAVFLICSTRDALAFSRADTQLLAREWCRAHLPRQARVLRERYTMSIEREDIEEHAVRYLCESPASDHVEAGNVDFVIASSLAHNRFFDPRSPYYDEACQAFYSAISNRYERAAVFTDRPLIYGQPTITVYRKRTPE